MKVKDIMTKSVVSLKAGDTIERAAEIMQQNNVGSVPVCDGDRIIGIITDRDIAVRSAVKGESYNSRTVRDVMSSNPVTGSPDMDIRDASRIMSERQIRRLPVVEDECLVGIVSLGDLATNSKSNEQAGDALSSISSPSISQS
ncbi:CBS domain-containing protein [Clostridium luticellarii]|jgi:CBS domain-containing protein|uniref:Hypoxic response protein 1 n=1 Tax=Clostridium luticellarii TaxID=1691940 RepID=A0A2T0BR89_9CLOT|nr:CBS domain-containing protein [Clostridium luticellarii]MCI1944542.1 CBS domain-containing protein [Clostridium luticellarii]MCI1968041.1 CBS domain-containing protein [Clostridium luticellarii]MCI1995567.1 CBS domain-containing protein [Clostridium luticellarii]MCI2039901.1 CBS domain-containing protein [Clostridium luticellarii]PRR86365.1 Hypoxic response protein 1 [Clostridium luticellarii]